MGQKISPGLKAVRAERSMSNIDQFNQVYVKICILVPRVEFKLRRSAFVECLFWQNFLLFDLSQKLDHDFACKLLDGRVISSRSVFNSNAKL